MKNLNKREKIMLGVLLVVVVGAVYLTYFLMPVLNRINAARSNISDYKNKLAEIKIISSTNEKLKSDVAELQDKYKLYFEKIPYLERDPEIAYNFKILADKTKAKVNNIAIGEPTVYTPVNAGNTNSASSSTPNNSSGNTQNTAQNNNSGSTQGTVQNEKVIDVVPVVIDLNANSYIDMMNFVKALENDKRLAEIETINFQSASANGAAKPASGMHGSFNVNYYYIDSKDGQKPSYNFNKGVYGKPDLFK